MIRNIVAWSLRALFWFVPTGKPIARRPRGRPAAKREKIHPSLRIQVYEIDGWRCRLCGSGRDLTVDHIVPVSKGGGTVWWNLQTLCRSCNSKKGMSL